MKKLFSLITLLVSACCLYSQSEVLGTIDIINKTNTYCHKCRVKDKCYKVKVTNLNPLLYDIKVSSENKVVPIAATDNILQQLIDGLGKATASPVETPADAPDADKLAKGFTTPKGKKIAPKDQGKIDAKSKAYTDAHDDFKAAVADFKRGLNDINDFTNFCTEIIGYSYDPSATQANITRNIGASSDILGYITSDLANAVPTEPSMITKAGVLSKQLQQQYDDCVSKYNNLKSKFGDLKKEELNIPTDAINALEDADKSMSEVKLAFEKFKPTDLSSLGAKTGKAYTTVHNAALFDREVNIYCPDVDSVLTKVEIVALSNAPVPGISPINLPITVVGGFKTFTAAGLMVNFFNVRDDKYYLDADSVVRRAGRRNAAFPSLSILQNFYVSSCKMVVVGGSLGLTANLNNLTSISDLRIFAGPSLIIGSKIKLVVSAGVTGGFAEELKGYFEKDQRASAALLTQEQNKLTEKAFRFGAYLGFALKIF